MYYFINTIPFTISLIFFDKLLSKIFKTNDSTTIYYFIHFTVNFIIAYLTFFDFYVVLNNIGLAYESFSFIPSQLCMSLHIYHAIVYYKYLTIIDWIHHLVNSFIMEPISLHYNVGKIVNFCTFIICGLPGGIDYFLLFLVKLNKIEKITEKRINTYLNSYIRAPGLTVFAYILYYNNLKYKLYNCYFIIFFIIGIMGNGIYFSRRININYGYSLAIKNMKKVG
jgi:hypothetical protein